MAGGERGDGTVRAAPPRAAGEARRRTRAVALAVLVVTVAAVVVVAEVIPVSVGTLSARSGIVLGTVVEVLLCVAAVAGGIVVLREARRRREGTTFLGALENGLATFLPRRTAHLVLLEPLLWKALFDLTRGRSRRDRAAITFSYWRQLQGFLVVLGVLSAVELVAVDVLVGVVWGSHWWAWLVVAVHAYGLALLAGLVASFVTRPHRIERGELVFADGCLLEGRVRLKDIVGVRRVREPAPGLGGRSGLVLRDDGTGALVAFGPVASVRLELVPGARVTWWGRDVPDGVRTVTISADDPDGLVAALVGASRGGACADGARRAPRTRPEA